MGFCGLAVGPRCPVARRVAFGSSARAEELLRRRGGGPGGAGHPAAGSAHRGLDSQGGRLPTAVWICFFRFFDFSFFSWRFGGVGGEIVPVFEMAGLGGRGALGAPSRPAAVGRCRGLSVRPASFDAKTRRWDRDCALSAADGARALERSAWLF